MGSVAVDVTALAELCKCGGLCGLFVGRSEQSSGLGAAERCRRPAEPVATRRWRRAFRRLPSHLIELRQDDHVKLPALVLAVVLLLSGCGAAFGDTLGRRPVQVPPYERDAFGDGWTDADQDCQDTRQEILIRDLVDVALTADGCDVATGTLNDLYTGTAIAFQRGQTTSDDVQIDHMIPLSYAWQAGAWQWTDQQREEFANDGVELRAVDGPTNNSKGDRAPSRWLPPNPAAHCAYAASWRDVASAHALVLDGQDAARIGEILSGC